MRRDIARDLDAPVDRRAEVGAIPAAVSGTRQCEKRQPPGTRGVC